ncbi:25059_t:CDS:2 [Gigaspora margarita]|uniref:25059_t:CDS:1 n=1 Tax=Gigaspora margarita TaxID=4874 RepID=A0ABN7VJ94_GIGMA|nr:25059_t:CDS:2 [Gigaspora margarita]
MVFCLVLGEVPAKEILFVVDITENISTISHFQSAIRKGKEPDLDHFACNTLILWKVINNEDRLKILDNVSCKLDIEQDLGGIKLFSTDGIPKDFYKQQLPSIKILHIIIQVPTTTPPYSGKTSLAQLIEYHLVNSPEYSSKYRIIRVSMLWGLIVEMDCSWETFGDVWRRIIHISWGCLQEIPNIYIIMFGAYGYHSANCAGISTSVEIPLSKCKGLLNTIFNQEELKEHVEKFCKKYSH